MQCYVNFKEMVYCVSLHFSVGVNGYRKQLLFSNTKLHATYHTLSVKAIYVITIGNNKKIMHP